MAPDSVSEEVSRFIQKYFQSFEQLEVLLILHEEPDRRWTAEELSKRLRSSQSSARKRLEDLEASGFLLRGQGVPATFRYGPDELEKNRMVSAVSRIYQAYRSRIIGLIFSGTDVN